MSWQKYPKGGSVFEIHPSGCAISMSAIAIEFVAISLSAQGLEIVAMARTATLGDENRSSPPFSR